MKYIFNWAIILATSMIFMSCASKKESNSEHKGAKAKSILDKAVMAHGGYTYDNSHYAFTFREKKYTFQNQGVRFTYTSEIEKDNKVIFDKLDNIGFTRQIDGQKVKLTAAKSNSYAASLNSVIYFATLPHKLKDPAVIKSYIGDTKIKNEKYHVVEVKFNEENGGDDFEDTYYYWIGKDDFIIDYFAYNYKVSGGGVRLRSAYNKRNIDGIVFQDYINYKAPIGTPLDKLPQMLTRNKLSKLSLIETENVVNLKKK